MTNSLISKWIVSHWQTDYNWIYEYTNNYEVYDKTKLNVGENIWDILSFIIDNYSSLPDVCVFVKDNLYPRYITKEEFDLIANNKTLTPILTKNHKTKFPNCFYSEDGLFNELNSSWYTTHFPCKYFYTYDEFAQAMGLDSPKWLKFAPGGNWIVPKDNILKRPKEFYEKLRSFVDWTVVCAEAHMIERSLYYIWS